VEGLTKSAAADYGREAIRVNCIAPGIVVTPMAAEVMAQEAPVIRAWREQTPLGRPATLEEVTGAAVFLASPDAAFVTGVSLAVDGGFLAQ